MLNFIIATLLIIYGGKMLITPAEQLKKQFPQMPSVKMAKIVGGFALIFGIGVCTGTILMWLGKI